MLITRVKLIFISTILLHISEKHPTLANNSSDLMLIYQDGVFRHVDKAASKILRWTSEEMTSEIFNINEKHALY